MPQVIYKYGIHEAGFIELPQDAQVLHAAYQNGSGRCIWALVDTDKPKVKRYFAVMGTGEHFDVSILKSEYKHISTYQDGSFVWHVFEFFINK